MVRLQQKAKARKRASQCRLRGQPLEESERTTSTTQISMDHHTSHHQVAMIVLAKQVSVEGLGQGDGPGSLAEEKVAVVAVRTQEVGVVEDLLLQVARVGEVRWR